MGHSRRIGGGVGDECTESCKVSNHFAFHRWSAQSAALLTMSSCAAGANRFLDLRRRAFALGGQASAEWSRHPGSMERRARVSVAPLRRISVGWMPARIGRLSAGVRRRHPVTIRKASLMAGSIRRVWALRHQTGAQYSVQCYGGCSQRCCCNTPARANKPPQHVDAFCQLFAKWLKVLAICELPVQRCSEIFGFGAEGQGFVVVVDP